MSTDDPLELAGPAAPEPPDVPKPEPEKIVEPLDFSKFPDRTPEMLKLLLNQNIVVDTDSHFVYLGNLVRADPEFLCLGHVDAHEVTSSTLSKEKYVHEARNIGVRPSRDYTFVPMARVVSISRLDDVKKF